MKKLAIVTAAALLSPLFSCTDKHEIAPDPATTYAGTVDAGIPAHCPRDLAGPELVEIATASSERYCIDRTEVTQAQFSEFLKQFSQDSTAVGPRDHDKLEAFKKSAQWPDFCPKPGSYWDPWPSVSPGACEDPRAFDRTGGAPDYPVGCVEWCTAHAYCNWAGKRLCGRIGGGPLKPDEAGTLQSQFYYACSQGGRTKYAYGNEYDPGRCDDIDQVKAVTESTSCRGTQPPFDAVLGLTGGVLELQDGYELTPGGTVAVVVQPDVLGDEGQPTPADRWCGAATTWGGGGHNEATHIGFRCCFDLPPAKPGNSTEPAP